MHTALVSRFCAIIVLEETAMEEETAASAFASAASLSV